MTQPNQDMPESAYNYDSLAAVAAKDQDDWMDELRIKTSNPFEKFLSGLFGGLPDVLQEGVEFVRAFITAIARALTGGDFGDPFDSITDALGAIKFGVADKITEHTGRIVALEDIAAATNVTPAYVADVDAMASIDRASCVAFAPNSLTAVNVEDGFTFTCADSSHSHVWVRKPTTYTPGAQGFPGSSQGQIFYAPIVVDRAGQVDKFIWEAGIDTSLFSISYYEVALGIYDPADGKIKIAWSSGNIKDDEGTAALDEMSIVMGIGDQVTPGQILFGVHQQIANGFGQNARSVVAAPLNGMSRTSVPLLDAPCYRTNMYSQGIPSEILLSDLVRVKNFVPYAAVSVISGGDEGS